MTTSDVLQEVRKLNLLALLTIHEVCLRDPAIASLAFRVDRAAVDALSRMSARQLYEIAHSSSASLFTLACPPHHLASTAEEARNTPARARA